MRFIRRWLIRFGILIALLVLALGAPIVYVETSCQGEGIPRPYQALLAPEHHRAETRTLMTYPEWHIVHAYENYSEVIRKSAPHDFGFFRSITRFWSSLCSVTEKSSQHGDIDSETKQLVYVIGTSFTLELALKALYEETIGRVFVWIRGDNQSELDKISANHAKEYAQFLQQVPWYKWRFREANAELKAAPVENLRDRERRFSLGLEYAGKAAYADVIAEAVATTGGDDLTLQMIIAPVWGDFLEPYENVKIVSQIDNGTVVEMPRYRALTHLLLEMAKDGLNFVEIAGNDQIMFTAISEDSELASSFASIKRQGFGDYRHLVLVEVPELADHIRDLTSADVRIEHIHDY